MAADDWEDEEGSPLPHRTNPDPSSIPSKPEDYKYGSSDEEDEDGEGGTQQQLQVPSSSHSYSVSSQVTLHNFSADGTSILRWDNVANSNQTLFY